MNDKYLKIYDILKGDHNREFLNSLLELFDIIKGSQVSRDSEDYSYIKKQILEYTRNLSSKLHKLNYSRKECLAKMHRELEKQDTNREEEEIKYLYLAGCLYYNECNMSIPNYRYYHGPFSQCYSPHVEFYKEFESDDEFDEYEFNGYKFDPDVDHVRAVGLSGYIGSTPEYYREYIANKYDRLISESRSTH